MSSVNLFEKYGGFAALYPLVGSFYDSILESELVAYMFDSVDMASLIEHQTKFLAAIMGGPGNYDDDLLIATHKNLKIKENEWREVVTILVETLNNYHIEEPDINALIGILAAKKQLIVSGE